MALDHNGLTRRRFLSGVGAASAGLALAPGAWAAEAGKKADELDLALIGAGTHGRDLVTYCLRVGGVRFRAVCDIWPYARDYAIRRLKAYRHEARGYEDYREMLAAEKDLDAVLVATPDWVHAEQTVACLEAGLHVYCEKEMATRAEDARRMVETARRTGRLLQVGRQHRSNPRYRAALDYVRDKDALGRITHVSGQWHGHKRTRIGWPEKAALDDETLRRYGYGTMERLRNWRWLKPYSAGPIANLGSHQVDVFNWFLGCRPTAVYASGGLDTYDFFDWYDNVSCVFEWDVARNGKTSRVRGNYEVLNTCEAGGFYETFNGTEGTLTISEDATKGGLWREIDAPLAPWEKHLRARAADGAGEAMTRAYEPIPASLETRSVYEDHLENFFEAIRGRGEPACPAETGYRTAVCVLKVNEAIEAGRRLDLGPDDFAA